MKKKNTEQEKKLPTTVGTIVPRNIVDEMSESYLDYAMSVIIARALPDVRDGLKPVHRRILYSMWDLGLRSGAKYRKSAAVVGECFVKDTMVLTSRGFVPIQDIQRGDKVYTQEGSQDVTEIYRMPARPLLHIRTANGLENTVTTSQKFKVFTTGFQYEWKEAKDLAIGDYIVSRALYPEFTIPLSLPSFQGRAKVLNEHIAYLLGQFISDGWIETHTYAGKSRIAFSSADKPIIEYIQGTLDKEFGYQAKIEVREPREKRYRTMYSVRINNRALTDYLEKIFSLTDAKAATKHIPGQIFSSPRSVIYAFLSGMYDGDGSFHKSRQTIHYGSVSTRLMKETGLLLHHLGHAISQQESHRHLDGEMIGDRIIQSRYPFYSLEVNGLSAVLFAEKLHLFSPEKERRRCEMARQQGHRVWNAAHHRIPYAAQYVFAELSSYHRGAGWYADGDGNKFRDGIKYPGGGKLRYSSNLHSLPLTSDQIQCWGILDKLARVESPLADKLNTMIRSDIQFLEVKEISAVPEEETFDIQVANEHEFIANGMVSHNCLGNYHPHGDTAVYDAMARMAQDFSLRYPLVHGQGNFGSIDGDSPAAMRYTEAKLMKMTDEMLSDIDKETVPFTPNYDGTRKEPTVLPTLLPNLLLNGTVGIAVGMATNIPPHNLTEVCDALIHLIDCGDCGVDHLIEHIKGPDFPTGGIIYNVKAIKEAYATGRGGIVMRAKTDIVESKTGSYNIIVSEVPYQVNKANVIEKIADLVREKKIDGIKDLRDESNKEGIRVVIELKKDSYPKKVLNALFKYTQLQDTFHVNLLALIDGIQPRTLNLKTVLEEFIKFRREVVTKRTEYELTKARDRAHILEGLHIALASIDAIIKTIKQSKDKDEAKANLMKKFKLSERQAIAILEMKLQQLANLERMRIEQELKEKQALIKELESILSSPKKLLGVVKKEIEDLKTTYGDERRTQIVKGGVDALTQEDLIPNESALVVITRDGYIKRLPPDTFKVQSRGGKGIIGLTTKEEDVVDRIITCMTHNDILFFTTKGRVFQLKAYDVPPASRTAKGQAIVNFLQLAPNEKVSSVLSVADISKYSYLMMVTSQGLIKKTELADFANVRRNGLIAVKLKGDDLLEWVRPTTGKDEVLLVSARGQAIRFKEKDIRSMGRTAAGVRGIRLGKGDTVVGMDIIGPDMKKADLMTIMEKGFGKRSALSGYKAQGRGGSGIKTAKITDKTGPIVMARAIDSGNLPEGTSGDLLIMSSNGQAIRIALKTVPVLGRQTQGVRVMRFKEDNDTVATVTLL